MERRASFSKPTHMHTYLAERLSNIRYAKVGHRDHSRSTARRSVAQPWRFRRRPGRRLAGRPGWASSRKLHKTGSQVSKMMTRLGRQGWDTERHTEDSRPSSRRIESLCRRLGALQKEMNVDAACDGTFTTRAPYLSSRRESPARIDRSRLQQRMTQFPTAAHTSPCQRACGLRQYLSARSRARESSLRVLSRRESQSRPLQVYAHISTSCSQMADAAQHPATYAHLSPSASRGL
jgi:hypothetical protein